MRLFITGGSGFIGGNLARTAKNRAHVVATYHTHRPALDGATWVQVDLTDGDAVARAIERAAPDVVVHLAAISGIDFCEQYREAAYAANVQASIHVAEACRRQGCRMIFISTDNVFDGERGGYAESDPPHPVNYYGVTKVRAEEEVQKRAPKWLIVRIPLTLGFPLPGGRSHFVGIMETLRQGKSLRLLVNEWRSPIDVRTLADALLELAERPVEGILHIGGTERVSRADIGRGILARLGLPEDRAEYVERIPHRAPRPPDVSFDVGKALRTLRTPLPDLNGALDRIWREATPEEIAV